MQQELMSVAIKLWDLYGDILLPNPSSIDSLILAFKASPFLLEFKLYFLDKLFQNISSEYFEEIVQQVESYLPPECEASQSLLVHQFNPIKAAMQLLEFLSRISKASYVLDYKIDSLKDLI